MRFDSNGNGLDLSGLVGQMPRFMTLYGIVSLLPDLDLYREHILNPLSHDDLTSNMYREEMVRCMNDIEQFSKYNKVEMVSCRDNPELFRIEMNGQVVEFEVRERWDYVVAPNGVKHYKNVVVTITNSTLADLAVGNKKLVKILYNDICLKLRIADDARPLFETTIFHQGDNKQLISY